MSLQAVCGERASSRAAVAARGWAGVPTRARARARGAREGPHYSIFVILNIKCWPLSSVGTWGREMAALGSPVSSLVITAVHSSAVNSFLLSHPSQQQQRRGQARLQPARPGPPHSPTPKTAELAWPPAPGPRLPQLRLPAFRLSLKFFHGAAFSTTLAKQQSTATADSSNMVARVLYSCDEK